MSNESMKKRKSAETLVKYSWMREHPAFLGTDCEIGVIDLLALNPMDRQAVLTAINAKFSVKELQENLV